MPTLIRIVFGRRVRAGDRRRPAHAARRRDRARLRLDEVASRSRSAGRGCGSSRRASRRSCSIPLVLVLGSIWDATGAAAAVLISTGVFAVAWLVALGRLRREHAPARGGGLVKVLIVSGIWPPDVGGPASHAPEVAEFLRARGHEVEVLTTAGARPAPEPYPVHWISRTLPARVRYALGRRSSPRGRGGTRTSSTRPGCSAARALGALLARAPLVVKLTGDPAYERAVRYGLTKLPLDDFQRSRGAPDRLAEGDARRADERRAALRLPERVAACARRRAGTWSIRPGSSCCRTRVAVPEPGARDELRRRHGFDGPTLVFAGRLVRRSRSMSRCEALRECDGVALVLAGDGPERPGLTRSSRSWARGPRALPRRAAARDGASSSSPPPTPCSSRRPGRTSRTRSSRGSPSGRR